MSTIRNPLHHEVIPAPGALKSWEEIEKRIQTVLPFAESIHIDICDGKFADNHTFMDPAPFAKYTHQAKFEVHFVTENPQQYIKGFADAGFQRFIGQVEKMPNISAFLGEAQLWGEAGLAYDGPTTFEKLPVSPDDVDVLLFYTGEKAGFSGKMMVPDRLNKVTILRSQDLFIPVEVDGGVNSANILDAKKAGVTRFVSTGFLFNGNPEENYFLLKELIK